MRKNLQYKTALFVLGSCMWLTGLTGCAESQTAVNQSSAEADMEDSGENSAEDSDVSKESEYALKKADSLDEAVISKINTDKQEITFFNTDIGRSYTLKYDGTTSIKDKYDEELIMEQMKPGDLVITSFVKEDKKVKTIQFKKDAFITEEVADYKINKASKTMMIDGTQFKLAKNLFVMANGKAGELEDINSVDVLRVSGTDHLINSIVVDKGHGYLRLANDEYFIGGWIEVGENLIKPITQDMLLTVPEGEYDVLITNKGYGGTKKVMVEANRETTVDVADLKGDEVKTGDIIFTITPSTAELTIDGKVTDYSKAVTMEYGIHQIVLKAEGYKTMTKYVKIGSELANLNIEMEAGTDDKETDDKEDDKTVSGNNLNNNSSSGKTQTNTNGNNKPNNNKKDEEKLPGTSLVGDDDVESSSQTPLVFIDSPPGAQLYLDGEYVGVVPTSFKKISGDHEVSFRKEGYNTRSYTLYFDEGGKNMTFSFAELVKAE